MSDDAHEHHDEMLAHHFDSHEQQFEAGKMATWIFLATEVLFFSGLFCAYTVYRANHPEIFQFAVGWGNPGDPGYIPGFLDSTMGAINTVVLLVSSFTMAWAVTRLSVRRTAHYCAPSGSWASSTLNTATSIIWA